MSAPLSVADDVVSLLDGVGERPGGVGMDRRLGIGFLAGADMIGEFYGSFSSSSLLHLGLCRGKLFMGSRVCSGYSFAQVFYKHPFDPRPCFRGETCKVKGKDTELSRSILKSRWKSAFFLRDSKQQKIS